MTSSAPPPSTPPSVPPPYMDDIKVSDDKAPSSSQLRRTFPFLLSLLHQPILVARLDPQVTSVVQSPTDPNVYTITECLIKAFNFKVVYDARFTPLPDGMLVESEGIHRLAPFKWIWKVVVEETDDLKHPGYGRCRVIVTGEAKVVGWLRFCLSFTPARVAESAQKMVQVFLSKVREQAEKEARGVIVTK